MCRGMCKNGRKCNRRDKYLCWQHALRVSVIFVRHGYSCLNVIHSIPEEERWYENFYRDPELTSKSLRDMERMSVPTDIDFVFSSTMIRAQETALRMFPNKKVTLVPYMREVGNNPENTISVSHKEQIEVIGDHSKRVDASNVLRKNGNTWKTEAYISNYDKWKEWLSKWVWKKYTKTGKIHFKVAVVTHSSLLMKIFSLKDRPHNNAMIERDILVRGPSIARHDPKGSYKFIYHGIPYPQKVHRSDVQRCRLSHFDHTNA